MNPLFRRNPFLVILSLSQVSKPDEFRNETLHKSFETDFERTGFSNNNFFQLKCDPAWVGRLPVILNTRNSPYSGICGPLQKCRLWMWGVFARVSSSDTIQLIHRASLRLPKFPKFSSDDPMSNANFFALERVKTKSHISIYKFPNRGSIFVGEGTQWHLPTECVSRDTVPVGCEFHCWNLPDWRKHINSVVKVEEIFPKLVEANEIQCHVKLERKPMSQHLSQQMSQHLTNVVTCCDFCCDKCHNIVTTFWQKYHFFNILLWHFRKNRKFDRYFLCAWFDVG